VQKKHEYDSLKCEPAGSKLGFMPQSLHSTLENLLTGERVLHNNTHGS